MRHRPRCAFRGPRPGFGHRRACTCIAATLLCALVLSLGGCDAADPTEVTAAGARVTPAGFPRTITNCGVKTTYQRPPQRAVTLNQHATEIMLALGLENRMVGTAYLDDQVLPAYRKAYRQIPVLADEYPSYEKLLETAPDFVYGGFASAFDKREGRSRERLREAGIMTHLNVESCTKGPLTMRQLWHELHSIATIFDVETRARGLIDDLKAQIAAARPQLDDPEPASVFVYDSGTRAPLTAGGHGIANEIIRLAGGRNVFADLNDSFADVSWEQVIERRPQWIVILDYGPTSVRQKKQSLLNNPALAGVPAIEHRRFAVVPLSAAVLGVRAPGAVTELAHQLHPQRSR